MAGDLLPASVPTADGQVFKLVQRNAKERQVEREDGGSSREDRAANNIHVQKVLSFISLGLLIMDLAGIERKDFSYVQIYYLKSRACHHHHHHDHGSNIRHIFRMEFSKILFFQMMEAEPKKKNHNFFRTPLLSKISFRPPYMKLTFLEEEEVVLIGNHFH